MKKLFLILSIFLFSISAARADENYCDPSVKYKPIADRYKTGLFFKVTKCGVPPSYLLGTMHSDDPKITEMLSGAFAKLAYAKSASFEIKFDPDAMKVTMQAMFLDPGSIETLQSIIGSELYYKFKADMTLAHPKEQESGYYRLKPWAAAVMLEEPDNSDDGVALDIKLENFAKQRSVPIFGLETAEEQMAVFEKVPQPKQIEFLRDSVDHYDETAADNKEMFDIYYRQDLTALQKLSDKSFDMITDKEFAHQLEVDLVDKRNRKMVDRMQEKIDAGGAFIAIGALHLTGQNGILKLLEDKGYFIQVVNDPNKTME